MRGIFYKKRILTVPRRHFPLFLALINSSFRWIWDPAFRIHASILAFGIEHLAEGGGGEGEGERIGGEIPRQLSLSLSRASS